MLYIEKTGDSMYPYIIEDAWDGAVYADEDDLKKFLKELQKILDNSPKIDGREY